jgi:vanillate O-demethylase monooxygenase subunit
MNFLRNTWYAAAWSHEISRTPLARTFLGEKVVMYRKQDGGLIAMGSVCPHRFAPLHKGKLHGDALACPYHGLQFGEGGACVHNPHGDLKHHRLSVKGYPLVERYSTAWIWMGDPALADEAKIPEFPAHSDPKFRSVYGYLPLKGNYQLVSDNLLDLSHTQYLHSSLTIDDKEMESQFDVVTEGSTVRTINNALNTSKFGFAAFTWPDGPERLDNYGGLRWQPPANMLLKVFATERGRPEEEGIHSWGAELVTPETETTSHYFWSFARDYRLRDEEFDVALQQAISGVFTNEDGWIIEQVQENMGGETDLLALKPAILPTDKAAVLARRVLSKLIKQEALPDAGVRSGLSRQPLGVPS